MDDEMQKKEEELYTNMLKKIHNYMNKSDCRLMEEELLYYIAKELNIVEKIKQYDLKKELYDILAINISEEIKYDFVKTEIEENVKNKEAYLNVKKIIIEDLSIDKIEEINDNQEEIIRKH